MKVKEFTSNEQCGFKKHPRGFNLLITEKK